MSMVGLKSPPGVGATAPTKRLATFASDLQVAVNHAIQAKKYQRVSVLALHWANDDLNVEPLERELLDTFKSCYGFETESFVVPLPSGTTTSHNALAVKLVAWSQAHAGPATLRIVVYSGHATSAGASQFKWNLFGCKDQNHQPQRPFIDWWTCCPMVESPPGDTCYIFDCCSPASGALDQHDGAEILAASTPQQDSASELRYCFTQVLINHLRQLNGQSQSLAQIFASIFRYTRINHIQSPPIHAPRIGHPSIMIASCQPGIPRRSQQLTSSPNNPRVLITANLDPSTRVEPREWQNWLTTNLPPGIQATDIAVEGVFQGSTLLMLSMPVEIWTMLPRNDLCYSFVGFVNSGNLLLPEPSARMPSREENRPFPLPDQASNNLPR